MKELLRKQYDSDFHNVINRWAYNKLAALAPNTDLSCLEPDPTNVDTVDEFRKHAIVSNFLDRLSRQEGVVDIPATAAASTIDASAEIAVINALPNAKILGYWTTYPAGDTVSGFVGVDDAGTVTLSAAADDVDTILHISYSYGGAEADLPACDCQEYNATCDGEVVATPPID